MLDGRTYIVTGAARGIGAAYLAILAELGAKVVGVDLDWDDGKRPSCESGKILVLTQDVAAQNAAENIIGSCQEQFGHFDGIINNAGKVKPGPIDGVTDKDWRSLLDVNLTSTFALCRAGVRYWHSCPAEQRASARIVNTTSGAGLHGAPGHSGYVAAKGAVAAFTVGLARELKGDKICVNAVAPVALTGMIPGDSMVAQSMKRIGGSGEGPTPESVALFSAFLVSSHCTFSGSVFGVCGNSITEMIGWQSGKEHLPASDGWTFEDIKSRFCDYKLSRPAHTQMDLLAGVENTANGVR
jgi:NAD(P)-dependent dehydrogenase (short-subunit alcohol dehydrogenase family)